MKCLVGQLIVGIMNVKVINTSCNQVALLYLRRWWNGNASVVRLHIINVQTFEKQNNWVQLHPGRGRSRAAPSPVGSSAWVCLHKAPPALAEEETEEESPPSERRMTGSVSEAPHRILHPARKHSNMWPLRDLSTLISTKKSHGYNAEWNETIWSLLLLCSIYIYW